MVEISFQIYFIVLFLMLLIHRVNAKGTFTHLLLMKGENKKKLTLTGYLMAAY